MTTEQLLYTVGTLNVTLMNAQYAKVNGLQTLDEIDMGIVRTKLMAAVRLLEIRQSVKELDKPQWVSDNTDKWNNNH